MIKTIEELKEFVKKYNDATQKMHEIYMTAYSKGARPRYGSYQKEFEHAGLWNEYNEQGKIQNALMAEHNVSRIWENFGDDGTDAVFEFLTTILGMNKDDEEKVDN